MCAGVLELYHIKYVKALLEAEIFDLKLLQGCDIQPMNFSNLTPSFNVIVT